MKKHRIALVVQCAPYDGSSLNAFRLAQTIVTSEEATLSGIFFYGDGVYHAFLGTAANEFKWPSLNAPLAACIASIERRGNETCVDDAFKIVGLGYLAALYPDNDKVIVLG